MENITKALQRQAYDYCEAYIARKHGAAYFNGFKTYPMLNHHGLFQKGQPFILIPEHIKLGFGYPILEAVIESDSDMWLSLNLVDYETYRQG